MFQSSQIIKSIHQIYLIHAIIEFQRSFNNLCSRLKQKITHLLLNRLTYIRSIRSNRARRNMLDYENSQIGSRASREFLNRVEDRASYNMTDLNQLIMANRIQQDTVSIPMQMLFLPFFVQSKVLNESNLNPTIRAGPQFQYDSEMCNTEKKQINMNGYTGFAPIKSQLMSKNNWSKIDFDRDQRSLENWQTNGLRTMSFATEATMSKNCNLTMRNPLIGNSTMPPKGIY